MSPAARTSPKEGEPAPCRCAPCNNGRWQMAPTPCLVLLLIAINYIPMVVFAVGRGANGGMILAIVLFHFLLGLMITAWVYTCSTDPGVPPATFQRKMAAMAASGEPVQVCRRSGLYKPPRSHFDSVTQRLTLNMDHFCPWVVNTIGFYNRKFFMLFLVYANLTLAFSLIAIGAQMPDLIPWATSTEAKERYLPGVFNVVVIVAAMILDVVLLALLIPFMTVHLRMAAKNESTIDGSRYPKYDVGCMANLKQVFGRNRLVWALPMYCTGPDGDGVHWPTNDGSCAGGGGSSRSPQATSSTSSTSCRGKSVSVSNGVEISPVDETDSSTPPTPSVLEGGSAGVCSSSEIRGGSGGADAAAADLPR